MNEEHAKRKLTAILSADVKGYSRLMEDDEEATVRTINAYREVMVEHITRQNGRVVDAKGDNVLAEFSSVVDAVRCAVEIQKELGKRNDELPQNRRMEFRIGINLGDVIEEKETIYGDGVNIAARLEALADGGGVCISGTAFDQIGKKLPIGYEYLGEQTVKNIEKPVRAYKVLMQPEYAGKVIGEERPKPKHWRWAAIGGVVVLVVVVAAFAIWTSYFRPAFEPASEERMSFPLPEEPSIAVLPFVNMGGDPRQDYLSDGISENLITALSKTPKMFVIASNSVFAYKGKPVSVKQVAEDLGVRYVLEGSVQRSEDRLRITAQLIDAIKGHHLWAERYDRELGDIFALQDEITMKILTAMELSLTQGEQARVHAKGTDNLEAYLKDLQARERIREISKESVAVARKLLEEAIALDPDYPSAYLGLGYTHFMDMRYGWSKNPKESFGQAAKLTKKALSLDDSLDVAHAIMGNIYCYQRQYEKAISEGETSIALGPNNPANVFWLAMTLFYMGEYAEAARLFEKAIRLDPFPPLYYMSGLGYAYLYMGRYVDSIATFENLLQRNPNYPQVPFALAAAYSLVGHEEKARTAVSDLLKESPNLCAESTEASLKRLPFKNPRAYEFVIAALRKVGLPDTPPLPLPDKPSIAVLPFVNMSADPEQEYFSDGISEEIITALSKTPKLFVIARNSTFTYKGKPVKVQQVGRELGVKYVLEGSVRKSEDKVRITAQLVDATTGHHLWAERYDRDLKDIFALQDEITMKIITAMEVKLTEGEQARMYGKGTDNLEAYLLCIQSREQIGRWHKDGLIRARQLAEKAIALDPNYAEAYCMLAWSYWFEVPLLLTEDPRHSIARAMELGKKAIAIDRSLANAHSLTGYMYILKSQYDEGISECEQAVSLEPNSARAHYFLGVVLKYAGRHEEAITMSKEAIRLNPIPPSHYYDNLAASYCSTGQHDEATRAGKKAVQIQPDSLVAHAFLAAAYSLSGRQEEARVEAEEVLRINPKFSVDRWTQKMPYRNEADREIIIAALRGAGLK